MKHAYKGAVAALMGLLILSGLGQAAEVLKAVYPQGKGRQTAESYNYQLLQLALEKSGRPFELRMSKLEMLEGRARSLILKGSEDVTVFSAGTSAAFEQDFLPVRIPLSGGLLGHRVFIINSDRQPAFSSVNTLTDLQRYTAGQGTRWSDVAILRGAGLNVETAQYQLLFKMVSKGRVDYFPRGVNEAYAEVEHWGREFPNLRVEKHISLVYPFASLFFVNKENLALHDAIYAGLKKAHEDGSFLAFFRTHPATAKVLQAAQLESRAAIHIANPLMSKETLAIPDRYWFNPTWLKPDQ